MQSVLHSIRRSARSPWVGALLLIVLAALALRLYGLDWDAGADLHPDELFVAKIVLIDRIHLDWPLPRETLFDPARSGLNPRSADPATGQFREFAYGALPLWVTDATAWGLSRITGANWNAADRAYLVGRSLSALLSALTVIPIAILGRLAGGRSVALLAALFAALAPMSIQLAHFFTTDSWLTFFVSCCLVACVVAARDGRIRHFVLAGALFGLAMATKGSVFTLTIPIAASIVIDLRRRRAAAGFFPAAGAAARRAAGAAIAAAATFFAFEPFALARPAVYLQSLKTQADIASGVFDVPFTRVYAGTNPILYHAEQFLRWGYGPIAGLLAIFGIGLLVALALRHRSTVSLILMSWLVAYGAVISLSEVKFLRYLEPLAPVCAVAAALAFARITSVLASRLPPSAPRLLPAALLVLTALWTAAFMAIYAHEHPRLAASRWIYGEVPPGSTLTAEYWDDALPRSLGFALSASTFGFATVMLDLYRDLPPPEASAAIYDGLAEADVVVQSSQRVESAILASPWRYPVQGRFFALLARGDLGFTQEASFRQPPAIGALTIDDGLADESFLNYDHPNVTIFTRSAELSRTEYDAAMSWALQRPWSPTRDPPRPSLLLDGPVGENPSVNDAQWSAAWSQSTPVAIALWLLLLLVLAVAGRPLAAMLLPSFPDAGWGLARTLALVVAAYPIWLGASLELIRFRAIWVVLSLGMVVIAGWRLRRRADLPSASTSFNRFTHPRFHAEAVFWVVFILFLVLRLANPDGWHPIWGGEKAMEFAQINAIERSAYFPPYDPWYADGYVNYYYYGFYLVAFLLKATGIPTEIGFNLALPTVMAMLASGGFSVAAALARGLTRSRPLTLAAGWLGALALSVLGNLSAVRGLAEGGAGRGDPFIFWTWNGSRAIANAITEFPFFSGLYADLHAHVVALPLTVLAIGLSLATALHPVSGTSARMLVSHPAFVARLFALALVLGTLSATNAWDVPVYALLAVSAIVMATARVTPWRRRVALCGGAAMLTAVAAWLLFLPFHRHFVALFARVALVRDPTDPLQFLSHLGGWVAITAFGLTVLLLPRRNGGAMAAIWPLFAVTGSLAAVAMLSHDPSDLARLRAELLLFGSLATPPLTAAWLHQSGTRPASWARGWKPWTLRALPLVVAAAGIAAVLSGRTVFAIALSLGVAAAVGWLHIRHLPSRFACLMLAAAYLTAAGVEILVVADDLIGGDAYRMNTVFKFYNQIWVLLALASAALVALMILQAAVANRGLTRRQPNLAAAVWSRAGVVVSGIILVASLTYPLLATGPRLAQRFEPGTATGSLDALAWMDAGYVPSFDGSGQTPITYSGDAAAIDWFFANVTGSPVVAEASIGPYRCNGSRISAATGLPTIVGWERHQQQQRYPDTLPQRVEDVRRLYTSSNIDEKSAILRRYNVAYVVLGDLERLYPLGNNECSPTGSAAGIAAFDAMLGSTLEVAFAAAGTTVYRVLPIGAG